MPAALSPSGHDLAPRPPDVRGRGAALFAVLLGVLPAEVLACPSCTLRAPESAVRSALLLGALVLAPFLLVGVGIWAARRSMREEHP